MIHNMSLKEKYFNLIIKGEKTIELRLFDDKRQKIQIGDKIKFMNNDISFEVNVIGLVRAQTFKELFNIIPVTRCGFTSEEDALFIMEQFYSKEMQRKNGVIGIVVKL